MTDVQEEQASDHDEDASIVEGLIFGLYTKEPGDDRFRIYDALAHHVEELFPGGFREELSAGRLTEDTKQRLMASPAAPMLLAYFVDSLLHFNAINGEYLSDPKATTAVKRQTLAISLSLVGKPGEKYEQISVRMGQSVRFQTAYQSHLATKLAAGLAVAKAHQFARTAALREVFSLTYREEYIYNDDTHRARMKALRKRLAHLPSDRLSG